MQSETAFWSRIQYKHRNQIIFPTNQSWSSEKENHFPGLTDELELGENA